MSEKFSYVCGHMVKPQGSDNVLQCLLSKAGAASSLLNLPNSYVLMWLFLETSVFQNNLFDLLMAGHAIHKWMIWAFYNGELPRASESEIHVEFRLYSTCHVPHEMYYLQFPKPAKFHLAAGSLNL